MSVDFWFGPGSRYSYLAATQVPRIAAKTGAVFRWRAMPSFELVARTGADPFHAPRGQYEPEYRHRDVARWAAHYGVPYVEAAAPPEVWRRLALACQAAEALGAAEPFARALLTSAHAEGRVPADDTALTGLAHAAGMDGQLLVAAIGAPETLAAYGSALDEAVAAGVFGVPSFVCDDGALFFGQDRIPLLVDHLTR